MISNKNELSKSFGYVAFKKVLRRQSSPVDWVESCGNEIANIQDAQRFYIVNYFRPSQQIVFI